MANATAAKKPSAQSGRFREEAESTGAVELAQSGGAGKVNIFKELSRKIHHLEINQTFFNM
jgi:hypothetical protein